LGGVRAQQPTTLSDQPNGDGADGSVAAEHRAQQTPTISTTTTVPPPTAMSGEAQRTRLDGTTTRQWSDFRARAKPGPGQITVGSRPPPRDPSEDTAEFESGIATKDRGTSDEISEEKQPRRDDPPSISLTTAAPDRHGQQLQTGGDGADGSVAAEHRAQQTPTISTTTSTTTTTTVPQPTVEDGADRLTWTDAITNGEQHDLSEDEAESESGDESKERDSSAETMEEKQPRHDDSPPVSPTTAPLDTQVQTSSLSTTTPPKQQPLLRRERFKALAPEKASWGAEFAKVANLQLPSSQRRMLEEGLNIAKQIAASNTYSAQDKLDALGHEAVLNTAGRPPWNVDTATNVAGAKVQLDLLSIQPKDRKLSPLSSDLQSKNKTFWIENADVGGQKSKAFLCKPASSQRSESGGPPGGEVAREALAGRAAQFLLTKGLDIGMPETHVVKLSSNLIPGETGNPHDVTCSVQQYGKNIGSLGTLSHDAKARIDGKKVAAIGVFDMMTLANDRHGGNVLIGENDALIPIDQGENFTETTDEEARNRLTATLGGCMNALLSIPSAHDPMPPEVAKAAASINPGELRTTLTADRDAVAAKHGDMKGMISDAAIKSADRAGQFTKAAAKMKPPISIAAAQVALATHAKQLLDPELPYADFSKNVAGILATAAKQQGAIKEVCLSSNTDYELLCQEVEQLGWRVQRRGEQTVPGLVSDPMTMMAILAGNLKMTRKQPPIDYPDDLQLPEGKKPADMPDDWRRRRAAFKKKADEDFSDQQEKSRRAVEQARDGVGEQDTNAVLLTVRQKALSALIELLPENQQAAVSRLVQAQINRLAHESKGVVVQRCRELTQQLTDSVLADQRRRFDAIEQEFCLDVFSQYTEFNAVVVSSNYTGALQELTAGNVLKCKSELEKLEKQGLTVQNVRATVWDRFSHYAAKEYDIPSTDPDVIALVDNMKQKLTVVAANYMKVRDRMEKGEFPKKT